MMGRLGSAAVGIACALLMADAPDAGAGWIAPVPVSQAGVAGSEPQVAVDGAGNTTVVWVSGSSPNRNIRSAYRPTDGSWEASISLLNGILDCHDPQLAVNPSGTAVVVADCDAGAAGMNSAYRASAGGSWTPNVVSGSTSGTEPRVALDGAGNAVLVWAKSDDTVQSSYRPAIGSWAGALQASPVGATALNPQVAIGPGGYAWAIWRHKLNREAGDPVVTVEAIRRQGSAAWDAATLSTVSRPVATKTAPIAEGEPRLAWSANGQKRIAVWGYKNDLGDLFMQEGWGEGGETGLWGEPDISLLDAAADIELPQVVIDNQGRSVSAWRSFGEGGFGVKASTTAFTNSPWSSPATLDSFETSVAVPQIAGDPAGDATIVWNSIGGVITAVTRPAGGAFAPSTPISTGGKSDPRIAMDTAGDGIAAWAVLGGVVEVAVNDVTPPVLSALSVPAGVETGVAVALSATASDAWSGASVSWDFGDGATASGSAVSHIYSAAGTKTVTATATDGAGNNASQSRQILVTQPPAGNPGPATKRRRVTLVLTVPKQSWNAIEKAKAVKLQCSLDPVGTCSATAAVTRAVAMRLGLKLGKQAKTLRIGSGIAQVTSSGRAVNVKVKLTSKARDAIDKSRRSVPVTLMVDGSAPGVTSATLSRPFKIKRP
jgi:PKD repeat protein